MLDNNIFVEGRYYNNEYIIKDDCAVLRMIRKSDGRVTESILDIDDVGRCSKYIWYPHHDPYKPSSLVYIRHRGLYRLHRFIMNLDDKSKVVDHINRKPLDNRKCNLRICTVSDNNKNLSIYKNNTSGNMGVYYSNSKKKYVACRMVNYKLYSKAFKNIEDAIAYRKILDKM
jgi:endonuclease